jgi:glycosyl transferase family 2
MLEPTGNAVPDSVTVCLTSCGRPDLLARTLDSFRRFNPGGAIVVSEDCADAALIAEITAAYPDMTILSGPERLGHMRSIDRLFSTVNTPYLFHLEDDWLFDAPVNWKAAIALLETRDDVANVSVRAFSEIKEKYRRRSDALTLQGETFRLMHRDAHPEFFGWSNNPGLMRTSLYAAYAPFGRMRHDQMSALIKRDGRREAYHVPGVAHHIGQQRNVTDPTTPPRPKSKTAKWVKWVKGRLYYAGLRATPY